MSPTIEIKDLSFGYDKTLILKNVNLTVNEGAFFAVTGPNGAGKSTLLKVMLGLLKPHKGSVHILGEDIQKFTQFDKIGYVPQGGLLKVSDFPATVYEVVALRLNYNMLSQKNRKTINEKVKKALEIVDLDGKQNSLIRNLSGGQLQRVLIARELIVEPKLLFLDEPTNGLDQNSISGLYALLNHLNVDKKMTIIIVTHHLDSNLGETIKEVVVDNKEVKVVNYV